MTDVVLGVGSNLGDRGAHLRAAVEHLEGAGLLVERTSSFYETEPVGPVADQPSFLNGIVVGRWEGSARELLAAARAAEEAGGRVRAIPKGPRTIDIDILYYGEEVIDEPGLVVPHPAIPDRRFVLVPLTEVAPARRHPLLGVTSRELLRATSDESRVEPAGEGSRR